MRILLTDPFVGGHHIEYATYLARCLLEAGDRVGFATWQPHPLLGTLEKIGVTLYYAKPYASGPVASSRLIRWRHLACAFKYALTTAEVDDFDVVHHLYVDRGELAIAWPLRRRCAKQANVFATLFWPYFVHTPNDGNSVVKRLLHRLQRQALGRMLAQGALDGLFVHTEDIRDMLLHVFGNNAYADRIHVVPDPATFPPAELSRDRARRQLGLSPYRTLVLFFGGLRWDKGWDVLLRAVPFLEGDIGVVLAGEADSHVTLEVERTVQTVPSQRLEARLVRVDDEDVDRYFVAADLVVIPYRRVYTGTSGVLQRAAAAGCPVVATDVGQIGSIVRRYGLGVLCPPEDPEALAKAIAQALSQHEEWREAVRARALEYAQSQNWRVFGAKVREGYVQVLQYNGSERKV